MRIVIGCDHRGLDFKQAVIRLITRAGHSCEDKGCYTTESVDYPDIARDVAGAVAGGDFDCGVLICGTGIGMSIAANKVRGIRAALCRDVFTATRARQHNDANILCLAAEGDQEPLAGIVETFLNTPFEGGRHRLRLDKIAAMEG
ncbi:MAG TPA: ribose 5-phosphate isomerase B [Dehalococcoidia bacterium]|nr:ribose 5-phosphate isomerase B [Dehalococcoidia bacterium]